MEAVLWARGASVKAAFPNTDLAAIRLWPPQGGRRYASGGRAVSSKEILPGILVSQRMQAAIGLGSHAAPQVAGPILFKQLMSEISYARNSASI